MPHRIAAGQYYFQVRTSDSRSVVQMVRPRAGYTPRQFLDAQFTRFKSLLEARPLRACLVSSGT